MKRGRVDWLFLIAALAFAASCTGGGCGGCNGFEPIPGGFPSEKRTENAAQVRVTQSGLAAVAANPGALLGGLGGMNGVLEFPVPASCSGDTKICCPGGNPQPNCGPVRIDLNRVNGDLPRLELRPSQNNSRLDVTLRARVRTASDLPVTAFGVNCTVRVDTAGGTPDDIQVDVPISFPIDQTTRTTRVAVGALNLANFASADVEINGGFLCDFADVFIGAFIGILRDQITSTVGGAIQDQTCKGCPSGAVSECGPFASACTNNVCMQGSQCLQELGLTGRLRGSALFASLSPGTTGALDLYEVAGGYATSNTNGLALGLLGGMLPGGTPRDRCGPPATPPAPVAVPVSPFFQGNTRPDTGAAFGVGIGIHKSQLDQFAYAAYDGGLLCLTLGGGTIAQLNTDTIGLVSPSLRKLVESNAPMAVGIRPQSPPQMALGRNVFSGDGQLTDPLLDIKFSALEIDFFTAVDDQFVRVFTVVADVHLPLGMQVTAMGELSPVIKAGADAFTNLSVKNSEAVTETPEALAAVFPSILELVLPLLSGGLPSIALPALGGLSLDVTSVTGVPVSPGGADVSFLALYANLRAATIASPVETVAAIADVREPPAAIAADPKQWRGARAPEVTLELGGSGLEWIHRVDGGAWSGWSTNPRPTVSSRVFWLAGTHQIEVRARQVGRPETIDMSPVSLAVELGAAVKRSAPARGFHGQPGEAGCNCAAGGSASDTAPFLLVLGAVVLPLRRLRRRALRAAKRLGAAPWLTAIALLPGCSCGSDDHCGDAECLDGEVTAGAIGRWTSIAADDRRVLVATYDQILGDLVVVDVTDPAQPARVAVDGVPRDAVAKYAADTYRAGIEEPGPDIGAWTSIAIADGKARVAYQDRDAGALKFAREKDPGEWESHVVDAAGGAETGRYASLAIDAEGRPAIAYLALGVDDGSGARITELRLARASSRDPGEGDWTTHPIAAAPGTCAGLCGSGEACVAEGAAQACKATTSDCSAACATGEVCVAAACTPEIPAPLVSDIATGTGLFVKLVVLPDGRLAAAYYDRTARALKLAVESAANANEFAETELHGGATGDRGLWASAVVDESGTIHIAYQDAIGDQLLYTSWNGTPGLPELVDDGQRPGDRTHPVGAAAAIYLTGGAPAIAYQDGLTADVYIATRSGAGSWTPTAFAAGPLLDGFSIAATTGYGGVPYVAWDRLDPAQPTPNGLAVENP